ncbi:MAG: hypothetical protein K6F05_00165 [Succinivibrio sp.]|nr:hypothetical protein [Succinivibrio sp.]
MLNYDLHNFLDDLGFGNQETEYLFKKVWSVLPEYEVKSLGFKHQLPHECAPENILELKKILQFCAFIALYNKVLEEAAGDGFYNEGLYLTVLSKIPYAELEFYYNEITSKQQRDIDFAEYDKDYPSNISDDDENSEDYDEDDALERQEQRLQIMFFSLIRREDISTVLKSKLGAYKLLFAMLNRYAYIITRYTLESEDKQNYFIEQYDYQDADEVREDYEYLDSKISESLDYDSYWQMLDKIDSNLKADFDTIVYDYCEHLDVQTAYEILSGSGDCCLIQ